MSVVALAGGVGGARLADGLAQIDASGLSVVVNTADDFRHLGLAISPDLDTVTYTLAGLADAAQGWGLEGETWTTMAAVEALGGPAWFRLGDRDLATHLVRTARLAAGERLTTITADLARALGVTAAILPMTDEPMATRVATASGELAFQDYFVRLRCEPVATGFRFEGADASRPTPEVRAALARDDLAAIVICPSNPYVSVDPILAVPGLRALLTGRAPVVAVSPIIAGTAVKGPAAKMMRELGADVSALGVARHYRGLVDGLVIDQADARHAAAIEALGIAVAVSPTLMRDRGDRRNLAVASLDLAARLRR